MLFVKTKLEKSPIEGIGLFAAERIPKGTLVQKFIDGFDLELNAGALQKLPEAAREDMLTHCYRHIERGTYILCGDNARFLNHSTTPNLIGDDSGLEVDVASRDIEIGEELTVDYYSFDADAAKKLSSG